MSKCESIWALQLFHSVSGLCLSVEHKQLFPAGCYRLMPHCTQILVISLISYTYSKGTAVVPVHCFQTRFVSDSFKWSFVVVNPSSQVMAFVWTWGVSILKRDIFQLGAKALRCVQCFKRRGGKYFWMILFFFFNDFLLTHLGLTTGVGGKIVICVSSWL